MGFDPSGRHLRIGEVQTLGLASSIDLAAGRFAARARYRAPRRFGETLDGIRMTLRLLTLIQTIIVHSEFLGRLDQAEVRL